GELAGVTYEEIVYEGHGPGGVAIMLQVLTDNKNRTVSEIRHFFTKCGGSLGSPNSVAWMFTKKGIITVQKGQVEEDRLLEFGKGTPTAGVLEGFLVLDCAPFRMAGHGAILPAEKSWLLLPHPSEGVNEQTALRIGV